jgi:ribosomal protein L11 methyltransferase
MAELALVEASEALGCGCMEATGPEGEAVLEFWVPAPGPDPRALASRLAGRGVTARVTARPQDDGWRRAMLEFHRPVEVAARLLVRPPWEPARPDLLDVEIDPGMAFGTAQHGTTRACLGLLAELPAAPGGVLDAGCGSGVLSIAARRLGHDPVWSIDGDPLAVEATIANARRNGVGLRVSRRTIGRDALPAAPLVLANLTATVLRLLATALPAPAPERLVASGMRPDEVDGVAEAFGARGLREVRRLEDEGWATALLERT